MMEGWSKNWNSRSETVTKNRAPTEALTEAKPGRKTGMETGMESRMKTGMKTGMETRKTINVTRSGKKTNGDGRNSKSEGKLMGCRLHKIWNENRRNDH